MRIGYAEVSQGKNTPRNSCCFNTTDTITAIPECRWANEGYHGIRWKVACYDLKLPEWATGHLPNILKIQEQSTTKYLLLQVILSLKDRTFLPWATVRSA